MTQLKEGDKVDFEHVGRDLTGTVLEVLPDGKVRVKDERGYMYRYQPENVRMAGTPKPTAPTTDSSNSNTNNQNQQTMAKKKDAPKQKAEPKAKATNGNGKAEVAAASNPALDGQKKAIAALTCKKHQRIYLYHAAGLQKEEVMKLAGCNAGEISNVKKLYADKPEKIKEAE